MKAEISDIKITLTPYEAKIIARSLANIGGNDPYGYVSRNLGVNVNDIVKIVGSFQNMLDKLTSA